MGELQDEGRNNEQKSFLKQEGKKGRTDKSYEEGGALCPCPQKWKWSHQKRKEILEQLENQMALYARKIKRNRIGGTKRPI